MTVMMAVVVVMMPMRTMIVVMIMVVVATTALPTIRRLATRRRVRGIDFIVRMSVEPTDQEEGQ